MPYFIYVLMTLGVLLNTILFFLIILYPELFSYYVHLGASSAGITSEKAFYTATVSLRDQFYFVLAEIFVLTLAGSRIFFDTSAYVKKSLEKSNNAGRVIEFILEMITGSIGFYASIVGAGSLLFGDRLMEFLVYTGVPFSAYVAIFALLAGAALTAYCVNSLEKKHRFSASGSKYPYLVTLQIFLIILSDLPCFAVGFAGMPVWVFSVLVANLLVAVATPGVYWLIQSWWVPLCQRIVKWAGLTNDQGFIVNLWSPKPVSKSQFQLRLFQLVSISKLAIWWISHTYAIGVFPEWFKSAVLTKIVVFVVLAVWGLIAYRALCVTLILDDKNDADYCFPFEPWLTFCLLLKRSATVLYLTYTRFFEVLAGRLEQQLKQNNVSYYGRCAIGFGSRTFLALIALYYSFNQPFYGINDEWLRVKGLDSQHSVLLNQVKAQYLASPVEVSAMDLAKKVFTTIGPAAVLSGVGYVGYHVMAVIAEQRALDQTIACAKPLAGMESKAFEVQETLDKLRRDTAALEAHRYNPQAARTEMALTVHDSTTDVLDVLRKFEVAYTGDTTALPDSLHKELKYRHLFPETNK